MFVVEEEKKRRREVEQQLIILQAEKKAAMAAATRVVDDNQERSSDLEKECAKLRAEMAAFGKNQQTNAGVVESEKKRRKEVELELLALQAKERATAIQTDRSRNDESKDVEAQNKARDTEREILQKQHQVIKNKSHQQQCYTFKRLLTKLNLN